MSRLWDKGEPLAAAVERFTVGRDPELDLVLVPHDALASAAHATMLERIGVLSAEELAGLVRELAAVAREARDGRFTITREQEDGHTAIENRLTERLGEAGRRIHTGRSRNDQVIAALRLWGREAVVGLADALGDLAERLLGLAEEHRETALPGYTHTRQAMPSTLGFLFAAHAEGILDALPWLEAAFSHLDRSPLGSASGYGVALPLDRPLVAELLGFAAVQESTLAVQNDRGTAEMLVLGAALGPAVHLARLAADLVWLSADEIRAVVLSADVTTGSSIMPQKRNPDVLELVRATAARLRGRHAEIAGVLGGLASGYHRDLQLTKEPFLAGLGAAVDQARVLLPVLAGLAVDRDRCAALVTRESAATDEVYRRVAEGTPFRDAYRDVAADPHGAVREEPAQAWRQRTHLGAPGAFATSSCRTRLAATRDAWRRRQERLARVWRLLD